MLLTPEQKSLKNDILTGLEKARYEAITKFLQKRCNTVAATFDKQFAMAEDIMKPIQSCPNNSGVGACNGCGFYISCDKKAGVVYCMKMKHINHKRRMNKQAQDKINRRRDGY